MSNNNNNDTHNGVECNICKKINFKGMRYKCLKCYDYDLCSSCYDLKYIPSSPNNLHFSEHAMQCILPKGDYDLYYGGESMPQAKKPQSYTCPLCAKMGFTEVSLLEHVTNDHTDESGTFRLLVCPICVMIPGRENSMTDDFVGHMTMEHNSGVNSVMVYLEGLVDSGQGQPPVHNPPMSRPMQQLLARSSTSSNRNRRTNIHNANTHSAAIFNARIHNGNIHNANTRNVNTHHANTHNANPNNSNPQNTNIPNSNTQNVNIPNSNVLNTSGGIEFVEMFEHLNEIRNRMSAANALAARRGYSVSQVQNANAANQRLHQARIAANIARKNALQTPQTTPAPTKSSSDSTSKFLLPKLFKKLELKEKLRVQQRNNIPKYIFTRDLLLSTIIEREMPIKASFQTLRKHQNDKGQKKVELNSEKSKKKKQTN